MKKFTKHLKHLIPGLLAAGALAVLAVWLSGVIPLPGAAVLALILGIALGNTGLALTSLKPGMTFTEKKVLETSIVLLGFGMNARIFSELGFGTWAFVLISVMAVMAVAYLVGKVFGLSTKLSVLIGAGSAICGSTAIAAVAPLIRSDEKETGLSLGIVNLLGTVGLALLPALSGLLLLNEYQTGIFIGGVLQSMGHVVGAAFTMGEGIGKLATVVKMGRIVMIIPLLILLYFMARQSTAGKKAGIKGFPIFIPLFIISIGLVQFSFFPEPLANVLATIGDYLLIAAMVGIGFKIRFRELFRIAGPALLAGTAVFALQILMYIVYLMI